MPFSYDDLTAEITTAIAGRSFPNKKSLEDDPAINDAIAHYYNRFYAVVDGVVVAIEPEDQQHMSGWKISAFARDRPHAVVRWVCSQNNCAYFAKLKTAKLWTESRIIREATGIVCAPPGDPDLAAGNFSHHINTWTGLKITPEDCANADVARAEPFLRHVRENVCGNNKTAATWLLNACAALLRWPGRKFPFAVVLHGAKGSGKTLFADIMTAILGKHNTHNLRGTEEIFKFNKWMGRSILTIADEVHFGNGYRDEGLKRGVTNSFVTVDEKYEKNQGVNTHGWWLLLTNNDFAVPATEDERRYLVLEMLHVLEQREIDGLVSVLEDPRGLARFLYERADGLPEDWREPPPHTDALRAQIPHTWCPLKRWWGTVLESGWLSRFDSNPIENRTKTISELHEHYARYIRETCNHTVRVLDPANFSKQFKKISGIETVRSGQLRIVHVPALSVCRQQFDAATGANMFADFDDGASTSSGNNAD